MHIYVAQILHLLLEIFLLWFLVLGFCFLIGGKKWGEKWWKYSWGNLKSFGEFLFKKILLLFGSLFESIGKLLSSWGR